jgi:hypothetical protein
MDDYTEELQRKFMLWMMLSVCAVDVVETSIRGDLFNPWYYPVLIAWLAGLVLLALAVPRPAVLRAVGWILFVSVVTWSAIVRNTLVS